MLHAHTYQHCFITYNVCACGRVIVAITDGLKNRMPPGTCSADDGFPLCVHAHTHPVIKSLSLSLI